MIEQWRPVHGFDGLYEVSDLGRVRRLPGTPHCKHGRFLRHTARHRYCHVLLQDGPRKTNCYISHLVAWAFLGYRTLGCKTNDWQVNHKDGNPRNNALTNLEYVTHLGNFQHASRMGLMAHGEMHYAAKLTDDDVRTILASEESMRNLQRRYGVSYSLITSIRRRERWKHIA
jgi:NUMOD4 motif/HNH endonuclease